MLKLISTPLYCMPKKRINKGLLNLWARYETLRKEEGDVRVCGSHCCSQAAVGYHGDKHMKDLCGEEGERWSIAFQKRKMAITIRHLKFK